MTDVLFRYHCAECGNTGEASLPDDSPEWDTSQCAKCGAPDLERTICPDPARAIWWDELMHASRWWARSCVEPEQAALLLSGINPNKDPKGTPANPEAHRELLAEFTAIQKTDPRIRTLAQWLDVARTKGIPYDRWIDEWMEAAGIGSGGSKKARAAPVSNESKEKTLPPRQQMILQTIRSLGKEPTALPVPPKGKGGVKAEVWKVLSKSGASKDTFDNDWQALRDGDYIADAPANEPADPPTT